MSRRYDRRRNAPLLDRLEAIARLKDVSRTGWVLRGVREPESVADHSWGTAQLCLMLSPPELDRARTVMIALVHDLAEVEVGDIPRRVAASAQPVSEDEKELRELDAIRRLTRVVGTETRTDNLGESFRELQDLWEEYSRGDTAEARFVRDMNLVDMCLQAVIYQRDGRYDPETGREHFPDYEYLDEFFATSCDRFTTATGRELYDALRLRYEALRDERNNVSE